MKTLFHLLVAATVVTVCGSSPLLAEEFDSGGVKIHYFVEGRGEPVILIHGLYSSAAGNWRLPGIVRDLAQRYQVIAFDNRGHGLSDKPEGEDQYGVEMVNDVVRLMDHLHIARAHVVGYSLGGMMAMKLMATHPGRVSSAVLGGMGWLKAGSLQQTFWEANSPRLNRAPAACFHGMARLALTEQEVKSIHTPVDIIVGDRDPCLRLYVEPLRAIRPDWPVHVVEGAGHLTAFIKPEFKTQLNAALERARQK